MEHIIQFGVTVDDDLIRRIIEQASDEILDTVLGGGSDESD